MHRGQVEHIHIYWTITWVSIALANIFSPGRYQALPWTKSNLLYIVQNQVKFDQNTTIFIKNMHFQM